MYPGSAVLCAVLAIVLVSAGCLSAIFPEPASVQAPALTTTPTPVPTTESAVATVPVSQMALQLSDLPSDYILKDRSDLTYLEMDQISHDLGWRAGYEVTYYRLDQEKYDMTEIRQVIDLYTLANMNKVFDIEEEDITAQENGTTQIYELPCPNMGDRTFAYRNGTTQNPLSITTYSIIFIKKDVYEELTMSGTTTDFEMLKTLAKAAADKIQ
jgi:hypothetical protein